jgi:PDZ domain-containing protein
LRRRLSRFWPGAARFRRYRRALLAAAVLLALSGFVFGYYVPSRYVTIAPGPAPDVATLVVPLGQERGEGGDGEGRFLLSTVLASSATPLELWRALTDPEVDLLPRFFLIPEGMSDEAYGDWGKASMAESQVVAAWQAWVFLGRETAYVSDGADVFFVSAGSPAAGQVQPGDVIESWQLAGRSGRLLLPDEFEREVLEAFLAGPGRSGPVPMSLVLVRDGETLDVTFPVSGADLVLWPFLGLALGARNPRTEPPVPVTFPPGDIGGPSGGLMLALQIVDDFSPVPLTAGKIIGGSGTIGPGGRVGAIGGVEKKLSGAVAAGATVFLVPEDDYQAALGAVSARGSEGLEVIPVGSLSQAYQVLVSLTALKGPGYNTTDLGPEDEARSRLAAVLP